MATCQICGREIKANSGLIAHHGYQRPHRGSGWQTASCFGARWRPYEIACDALPPAIESLEQWIATTQRVLAEMIAEPPPEYKIVIKKAGYPTGETITVRRPEGFDPQAGGAYRMQSYESQFYPLRDDRRRDVKRSGNTLEVLRKRLADWEPSAKKAA